MTAVSCLLSALLATLDALAAPILAASPARPGAEPPAAAPALTQGSAMLKIIHGWPDDFGAQDRIISTLQTQGFGGIVCNVSFDQYLESDLHWTAFKRAVEAAKRAGFDLWLYDEKGYPSAAAGGLVLKDHPEWQARGLLVAEMESTGGVLTMDIPPGNIKVAAAYPLSPAGIDLKQSTNLLPFAQGPQLTWTAPEGHWKVLILTEAPLFAGTHAAMNLWQKLPYPNLLSAAPTRRFIERTHDSYAAILGTNLAPFFTATFTDEPSLMSLFLERMPYAVLPWAPEFPQAFETRRGYALEPLLPLLVAQAPGAERLRSDFWRTVGELVSENFFGQLQTWCRAHGLLSGGHLLMEENVVAQVPLYGDFFACLRRLDAPSIDCLTSIPAEVPWFIARVASSAADLEGRAVVMCETSDHGQQYRPAGDKRPKRVVTEEEIRGTCNRLFVSGVNVITSYYSFAGLDDAALRRLNECVRQANDALQGGSPVADIALLYPTESLWPKFVPGRHMANAAPEAVRIETLVRNTAEILFTDVRDFTVVDSRTLAEATVEPGWIVSGRLRWRVVILPGADTLPLMAWRTLADFVRSGGIVISVGSHPANSERDFPSAEVQEIGRAIFGVPSNKPFVHTHPSNGAGVSLPGSALSLLSRCLDDALERDVHFAKPGAPIRATHRRLRGAEVFFLINDSPKAWTGTIGFSASGLGTAAHLGSGKIEPLAAAAARLDFEGFGAKVIRFPSARERKRLVLSPGPLRTGPLQLLPTAAPTVGHGQFVQAELAEAGAGERIWSSRARLTQSNVDTHLFLTFALTNPAALRDAEAIVLDTWVPPSQRTASQILVIVREEKGGDFFASTGRSLSTPGDERSVISLRQLQLAGWSSDPDGQLDLSRVHSISIGWGGYYGAADEQIEFRLSQPHAMSRP